MLYTKFHQNRPSGSWKEDFLKCFTIYGQCSHLGHVTDNMLMDFINFYLQAYKKNLVENGPVVSEKSKINLHL